MKNGHLSWYTPKKDSFTRSLTLGLCWYLRKGIATFKPGKPREHQFDENELKYLGVRSEEGAGNHYYLIAGEYEVCVDQIEDFERVN